MLKNYFMYFFFDILKKTILVLMLSCLAGVTAANELSPEAKGRSIVEKSKQLNEPDTESSYIIMSLYDGGDKPYSNREIQYYGKRIDEQFIAMYKILSPRSLSGFGLKIEEVSAKDNYRIETYTPTTRQITRIASKRRTNWFLGSEFTYEDFEGFKLNLYEFVYEKDAPCNNDRRCYMVVSRPINEEEAESSGYSIKRFWFDMESYAIIKVDFYDKANVLWKTLTAADHDNIGKYYRSGKVNMENHKNMRRTVMEYKDVILDNTLQDYYVSNIFLRRR